MTHLGLQYALWPVHPQPYEDELLSSWVIRLAHGNGFKAHTFANGYFESGVTMWARDVDRTLNTQNKELLANRTGQTYERVNAMSLERYTGSVFECLHSSCHVNWVLPLGVRGRAFRRPGLMFCPACFRDSEEPYLKGNWRMAWSTVCTVHQRMLFDRCPACGMAMQPHMADRIHRRRVTSQTTLANCASCAFDLRDWEEFTVVTADALARESTWHDASILGYTNHRGLEGLHAIAYFNGLRIVTQFMLKLYLKNSASDGKPNAIERLPIDVRHEYLSKVWATLTDWPNQFLKLCATCPAPFTQLIGIKRDMPWWFYSVCDQELRRNSLAISPKEVEYLKQAIQDKDGKFTLASVAANFGRDISGHVALKKVTVSTSVAHQFFEYFDQKIDASTDDQRKHFALIRDKVMFLCAQHRRLTQKQLAELIVETEHECVQRCHQPPKLVFPMTDSLLNEWIVWYVHRVRTSKAIDQSEKTMFLSSWRKAMSANLIGNLYMYHARMSGVVDHFPSYAHWANSTLIIDG